MGLRKKEFIEIKKVFVGKKPQTSYRVTKLGKQEFQVHLKALESLLN